MKKIILLIFFLFVTNSGYSQILLKENFDYPKGHLLTDYEWQKAQGGDEPIVVSDFRFSFDEYLGSDIGNVVVLDPVTSRDFSEIIFHTFDKVNEGTVYLSFILHLDRIEQNEQDDHFISLGTFEGELQEYARISIITTERDLLKFGLQFYDEEPVISDKSYDINTTYLFVLKYEMLPESMDDRIRVFIFEKDDKFDDEPKESTLSVFNNRTSDPMDINKVFLKKSNQSANTLYLDGLQIGRTWADAPLPVELTNFTAWVNGNQIHLKWNTVSELNNYGFEVETLRHTPGDNQPISWNKIGFISGKGSTTEFQTYSFSDILPNGNYQYINYRLKQIDFDGHSTYSEILTVEIDQPERVVLLQNYPNPFNPETNIRFYLPKAEQVRLFIYNSIGQEIAKILPGELHQGFHSIPFSGENLSSGIYITKLETSSGSAIQKMLLMK